MSAIYILGAGAIGVSLAAFLKTAGKEVYLLRSGLASSTNPINNRITSRIEISSGELVECTIPLYSLSDFDKLDGPLIICTKTMGNRDLATQHLIKNNLSDAESSGRFKTDHPVILLQNGLHIEKPFIEAGFTELYRGVLFVTAQKLNPPQVQMQSIQNQQSGNLASTNPVSHNQISQNQLFKNQPAQNQLSQSQLTHNQLSQNQLSQNQLTHNKLTHNQLSQNQSGRNEFIRFKPVNGCAVGLVRGSKHRLLETLQQIQVPHFDFRAENDIQFIAWKKAMLNCVFNSICPLLEIDNGIFHRDTSAMTIARDMLKEAQKVAAANGIDISMEELESGLLAISQLSSGQDISTLQDIRAGRPTEIDSLNFELIRLANTANPVIPTPLLNLAGRLTELKSMLHLKKQ